MKALANEPLLLLGVGARNLGNLLRRNLSRAFVTRAAIGLGAAAEGSQGPFAV